MFDIEFVTTPRFTYRLGDWCGLITAKYNSKPGLTPSSLEVWAEEDSID